MNVKVVVRLIESEKEGIFANATLLTADDGTTAVELLRNEMAAGRAVHFVLMDYVMVMIHSDHVAVALMGIKFDTVLDLHAWARGRPRHERRSQLPRSHLRYLA